VFSLEVRTLFVVSRVSVVVAMVVVASACVVGTGNSVQLPSSPPASQRQKPRGTDTLSVIFEK
jgi:hypothetical protein